MNGVEKQFATNHLGHFLLINLLIKNLEAAKKARVVMVSSSAHNQAPKRGIEFDNLRGEKKYASFAAYGQSKLATNLFAKELSKRTSENVVANALHPGSIRTNLNRSMKGGFSLFIKLIRPFMSSVEQGASTSCYLASSEDVEGVTGKYFANNAETSSSALSKDDALAEKLWQVSEELVGL